MTEHRSEHILEKFALVPEEFSQEERETIEKHISECASCKELWAGLGGLYRTVSENMQSPPSERDSSLADRLLGKRRRALPLHLLELPMPGERAIDTFVEVIEPYKRPLAHRFVHYVRYTSCAQRSRALRGCRFRCISVLFDAT